VLSVADEMAGEGVQCPKCGLLVDVPGLDDLAGLAEDGTIRMEAARPKSADLPDNSELPHFARRDPTDLRPSLAEFLKVGVPEEQLLELKDDYRPGAPKHPKYDPVTGELIVPLEVAPAVAMAVPEGAQPGSPVLAYERARPGKKGGVATSFFGVFAGMFRVPNMIVWLAVIPLINALNLFFVAVPGAGLIYLFTIFIAVSLLTIGHFGNTIEETGPSDMDELPAPIKQASLYEDILLPFVRVAAAFLFAYWPLMVVGFLPKVAVDPAWYGVVVLGTMMLPAAVLTTTTSGSYNNLLPHRVLPLPFLMGTRYWIASGSMLLGTLTFFFGSLMLLSATSRLMMMLISIRGVPGVRTVLGVPLWVESTAWLPLLLVGSYFLHASCWQFGVLYRELHDKFPWVLQRFISSDRNDTAKQLQKLRAERAIEQAKKNAERSRARVRAS
jgi:hypothetical protein